jgi:hypothetical protein
MQNSLMIYANHNIDFSSKNYEKIAKSIKIELGNLKIENLEKLKSIKLNLLVEAEPEKKEHYQQAMKLSSTSGWISHIKSNKNYKYIVFEGICFFSFHVTDKHIQFFDIVSKYDYWFRMEDNNRCILRNFIFQIITALDGTFAVYISDNGKTKDLYEEIKLFDKKSMEQITNELKMKYGEIENSIDDYEQKEKYCSIELPPYFIDYFEEIKKNPLTWDDIENSLRNSIRNAPGETDQEKLDYFKKKIIGHLDKQQEEIEKKNIIPFPVKGKK